MFALVTIMNLLSSRKMVVNIIPLFLDNSEQCYPLFYWKPEQYLFYEDEEDVVVELLPLLQEIGQILLNPVLL